MGYRIQGAGCRVQDAGARRVGNAEGMRGIVRKHDCALPAQYTKHSNARGHSAGYEVNGRTTYRPSVAFPKNVPLDPFTKVKYGQIPIQHRPIKHP